MVKSKRSPLQSRHLSLRFILIVPFLLQIAAVVGLTGYFSWRNGQKTVAAMALRLSQEVTAHIEEHVQNYTSMPALFLEVNQAAIRTGILSLEDYPTLLRYFWEQTQLSDAVPYVYYGNQKGDFIGVWKQSESLTTFRVRDAETAPKRQIYRLDEEGNSVELINEKLYDPRTRPWYKAAINAGEATWSPIYLFAHPPSLGITHTIPIYDDLDQPVGILAADITLANLSEFLQQLNISRSGQVFMIERSGEIVSSSVQEPPFLITDLGEKRLAVLDSKNHLIRATAEQLLDRFKRFDEIATNQQFSFNLRGKRQFVEVKPLNSQAGIDWLMVVMIPEADFTEHLRANNQMTLLLCTIAMITATSLGVLTSRWLARPMQRMNEASQALVKQVTSTVPTPQMRLERVEGFCVRELENLAHSFNWMAEQLKSFFTELSQINAELKQRVEGRTQALKPSSQDAERPVNAERSKDDLDRGQ